MRVLLIDGDELLWRVAVGARAQTQLCGELARRIEALQKALRADRMLFALSHRDNWRKVLWPGYKAHRRDRARPALLPAARAALAAGWETRCEPLLEADDVLGLAATEPGFLNGRGGGEAAVDREPPGVAALRAERGLAGHACRGEERVIVSRDKDLLTVPGLHGRADGSVRRVDAAEGALAHLTLTLAGDAADGYKGCPGIGRIKAERILLSAPPDAGARWRAVLKTFETAGLGANEALLQARLARVLQAGDLPVSGRPRLWTPPTFE